MNFTAGLLTVKNDYKIVGAVVKCNGVRTKIRNPTYENVRLLRGNQPKLQYRYLMLRSNQKVSEYLKYYQNIETILKIS